MYKYIRYLFISLAVFLLIVSCTNSQETFSQSQQPESGSTSSLMTQSPTENTVLEVWWDKGFNPEEDEALEKLVNEWEQQTGNKIKLSFYGTDELFQKLERDLRSGELPDLIAMFKGGPMKLYKIGQPWQNEHFYCQ
jgi:multiple sugar transport system substrate-binding protein